MTQEAFYVDFFSMVSPTTWQNTSIVAQLLTATPYT